MKIYKFKNSLGLRSIYGVPVATYREAAALNLFRSYFLFTKNSLIDVGNVFSASVSLGRAPRQKMGPGPELSRFLFGGQGDLGATNGLLRVEMPRSEPKFVTIENTELANPLIFIVPIMLPYQKSDVLSSSVAAKENGYTSEKDLLDLKYKRMITVSWDPDALPKVRKLWMPFFEKCPTVIEGKYFNVFCGACKNVFSRLADGCSMDFLSSTGCHMGLNTTRVPEGPKGLSDFEEFTEQTTAEPVLTSLT